MPTPNIRNTDLDCISLSPEAAVKSAIVDEVPSTPIKPQKTADAAPNHAGGTRKLRSGSVSDALSSGVGPKGSADPKHTGVLKKQVPTRLEKEKK